MDGIVAFAPLDGVGWAQTWPVITLGFGVFLSFLAEWFRDRRTTERDDKRDTARQALEDEREAARRQLEDAREREKHNRDLKREHEIHQRALLMEIQRIVPDLVGGKVLAETGHARPEKRAEVLALSVRLIALNCSLSSTDVQRCGETFYAVLHNTTGAGSGEKLGDSLRPYMNAIGTELAKLPEV